MFDELIVAAKNGNIALVKFLIKKGADVDQEDRCGETALIKAVRNGHTEVVGLLINNGANADQRDCYGESILNIAANKGYPEIARLLLRAGADYNSCHRYTELLWAVVVAYPEIVELFLSDPGKISFKTVAETSHTKVVKLSSHESADGNQQNNFSKTLLIGTAASGHIDSAARTVVQNINTVVGDEELSGVVVALSCSVAGDPQHHLANGG